MDYDTNKVDEYALALLQLTLHNYNEAWKGIDWDVSERLFEKGYIYDPKNKKKSLELTPEGLQKSEELFQEFFAKKNQDED